LLQGWDLTAGLEGIGGPCPSDHGFLPCRLSPMPLAVTTFRSSGAG
jgi:hypothetical protein